MRGATTGMTTLSTKLRWLLARSTPPVRGTCSMPEHPRTPHRLGQRGDDPLASRRRTPAYCDRRSGSRGRAQAGARGRRRGCSGRRRRTTASRAASRAGRSRRPRSPPRRTAGRRSRHPTPGATMAAPPRPKHVVVGQRPREVVGERACAGCTAAPRRRTRPARWRCAGPWPASRRSRRPWRQPDLRAALVDRPPRQRHPVLPADQPTDPAEPGRRDGEVVAGADAVEEPLVVGRHQLAVPATGGRRVRAAAGSCRPSRGARPRAR